MKELGASFSVAAVAFFESGVIRVIIPLTCLRFFACAAANPGLMKELGASFSVAGLAFFESGVLWVFIPTS
jgi:hypothetical protein